MDEPQVYIPPPGAIRIRRVQASLLLLPAGFLTGVLLALNAVTAVIFGTAVAAAYAFLMIVYIPRSLKSMRVVLIYNMILLQSGVWIKDSVLLNPQRLILVQMTAGFWTAREGLCRLIFSAAGRRFRLPLLALEDAQRVFDWLERRKI